jgi:hypothetical protein
MVVRNGVTINIEHHDLYTYLTISDGKLLEGIPSLSSNLPKLIERFIKGLESEE